MTDRHQRFAPDTAHPTKAKGLIGATVAVIVGELYRLHGWTLHGDWPDVPKAVVLAAPHTSNMDGFLMLAAAAQYRVKLSFMGKKSLTQGLFGPLMLWLGCIPVDRSAAHGMVAQMVDAFGAKDRLILAIPPEGTRSAAPVWKAGYYHIAVAAKVPIIFAVMDYSKRTTTISGMLYPTGDFATDWPLIRSHYKGAQGAHPENFILPDA